MANGSSSDFVIDITTLDFNDLQTELINFITSTQRGVDNPFTDHDQAGSNLDLLTKILAFVTHILAYNLNQGINETYLGTAQLRSNILKIVKILNYTPYRANSAQVTVNLSDIILTTVTGAPNLLKYDKITSEGFNFYYTGTNKEVVDTSMQDLTFYEGTLISVQSAYTGDSSTFQEFEIEDTNIGNYLSIYTYDSGTNTRTEWEQFEEGTIYSDPSTATIYFVEETEFGYKISFGNNQLGRVVATNEVIGYDYIQPSGTDANNLSTFTWTGGGTDENFNSTYTQRTIESATITLDSDNGSSYGSKAKETIDEIKFNAPKFFSTQARAVTEDDYFAIIMRNSLVEKASVIGGNNTTPVQLGKVFITVKPDSNTYPNIEFTESSLDELRDYLLEYSVVTIDPILRNPQFIYLKITTTLRYTSDEEPNTDDTSTAIQTFVNTENNDFGDYLEFTKLTATIDNADTRTTSNISTLEKYALIKEDNISTDTSNNVIPGQYEIQLSKNLKTSFTTRIEQYNFDNLVYTYNENTDYLITYNNSIAGNVTINFINTGEELDLENSSDNDIALASVYKNGTDQRFYIRGDAINNGDGTVDVNVESDARVFYGLVEKAEVQGGRYVIFTSGNMTNHIFRILDNTGSIGSDVIETGDPENFYFTIEPMIPGDDVTSINRFDLFQIYDRPPDLQSTGITLSNGSNFKVTNINSLFTGFYRASLSGAIVNNGVDDIYISIDTTYSEMPDFVLEDLDFEEAVITPDPVYSYKLFFDTVDADIFINNQQIFNINSNDITISTEKVTIIGV